MAELEAGLSPEDLQTRLGELYPQMDEAQLAEVLAKALFVSEVWGRVNASAVVTQASAVATQEATASARLKPRHVVARCTFVQR